MKFINAEKVLTWGLAILLFPVVIIVTQVAKAKIQISSPNIDTIYSLLAFILLQIVSSFLSFAVVFFVYSIVMYQILKSISSITDLALLIAGLLVGNSLLILYEILVQGSFFEYDSFNQVRFTVARCIAFSLSLILVSFYRRKRTSSFTKP